MEGALVGVVLAAPLISCSFMRNRSLLLRLLSAGLLCCSTSFWVHFSYAFPDLPLEGIKGTAVFSPSSIALTEHPFGDRWTYKGTICSFVLLGKENALKDIKNVPVSIHLPKKGNSSRPLATNHCLVSGTLKKTKNGNYFLQPSQEKEWIPIEQTWAPAELRHQLKKYVKNEIQLRYGHDLSSTFLAGMATGDFNDRLLAQDFGRFGLQHIMAISGFHFAIIAGFFSLLLRIFLRRRTAMILLVFMLTSYFLFLGASASIMRGWAMCSIACIGIILERRPYGLNSLGVAGMAVLLYDPLQVLNLGFQFSFAVTAAILLLFEPIDIFLQKAFKKRSLAEALAMPSIDKHGYILLDAIRQGASMTLAVNFAALPLTLFYFQKFPLMSLLFNLFFPFFVSVAIILLLLATGAGLLCAPFGRWIDQINSLYTQALLNFTTYTPRSFDVYLRTPELAPWVPLLFITLMLFTGIYWRHTVADNKQNPGFI